MPNPDFNEDFNQNRHDAGSQKKARENFLAEMPVKDVNWPGLPGKTQSKDRSGGTKRIKQHPVSEGL